VTNRDQFEEPVGLACASCETLTEALREAEQQCREIEDEWASIAATLAKGAIEQLLLSEREHSTRIATLERRRNCALEVLLKHQRLDHC